VFMTNVITNAAAAAFMFPIAISMSAKLGVNYMPFVIILMLGTSYAFINPAGYQTNMMVQTPGGYKFMDYVKLGYLLPSLQELWRSFLHRSSTDFNQKEA
jgi:di/tricarboxylate transporter